MNRGRKKKQKSFLHLKCGTREKKHFLFTLDIRLYKSCIRRIRYIFETRFIKDFNYDKQKHFIQKTVI